MKNIFIRRRINEVIAMLQSGEEVATDLLESKKYSEAVSILEDAGCINIVRKWDGGIHTIFLTHKAFSVYHLDRHDVWMNRFWGFISGLAVGILCDIIRNALL